MATPVQKKTKREQFEQAEHQWDLERLYRDLVKADVKRRKLTNMDKLHLRGLLCGCSPAEIADKLNKDTHGVKSDLSTRLYSRVKDLLAGQKIDNWRDVTQYLEEVGYKKSPTVFSLNKSPEGIGLPIKIESMMGAVIINQYNHFNQRVLEIRIVTPTKEEDKEKKVEESSD
jgi:hypothetical protein